MINNLGEGFKEISSLENEFSMIVNLYFPTKRKDLHKYVGEMLRYLVLAEKQEQVNKDWTMDLTSKVSKLTINVKEVMSEIASHFI